MKFASMSANLVGTAEETRSASGCGQGIDVPPRKEPTAKVLVGDAGCDLYDDDARAAPELRSVLLGSPPGRKVRRERERLP